MDIASMIKNAPGLLDGLQSLGLSDDNIASLTGAVTQQLDGGDGFDLTDVLKMLGTDDFMSKMDVGAIASNSGIDSGLVEKALGLIAPVVSEFDGANLGGLGKLASSLFSRD